MTYLILHKVRGEPAFDVAESIGTDSDGDIWIIPTSGHRAYPYWKLPMLAFDFSAFESIGIPDPACVTIPADWPDHYACNDRPLKEETYTVKKRVAGLLESLGLVKPTKVERRF